jgi:hypothetical protein
VAQEIATRVYGLSPLKLRPITAASLVVIFNSHMSELHETNTEELQHDGPAETLICIIYSTELHIDFTSTQRLDGAGRAH